jgi:hypothetical protein
LRHLSDRPSLRTFSKTLSTINKNMKQKNKNWISDEFCWFGKMWEKLAFLSTIWSHCCFRHFILVPSRVKQMICCSVKVKSDLRKIRSEFCLCIVNKTNFYKRFQVNVLLWRYRTLKFWFWTKCVTKWLLANLITLLLKV